MLAFLVAFAAQPLGTQDVPLLSVLAKHKAFFAPLLKQLEATRTPTLPTTCGAEAKVALRFDVAAYLTEVAKNEPRTVRMLQALGLAETKALTVCFEAKRITGTLEATRLSGLLATLLPAPLDLDRLAGEHYWLARASFKWPQAWEALNEIDRAQTGLRISRLDALLIGGSAIMDADAEGQLVRPLTGKLAVGEVVDGKRVAHFVELDATDTAGYANMARALNEQAPHREFGRKKKANEWGFFGGITGFAGESAFFLQLDPKQVRLTDSVAALDRPHTFKGTPAQAAILGTFDLQRLRKLFERVGRPDDVRTFVRMHKLAAYLDLKAAPAPASLVVGDRVTYSVSKEGERLNLVANF